MEVKDKTLKQPRTFQFKKYESRRCIQKYSYMLVRPPRLLYNQNLLNPVPKYKGKYGLDIFHIPFPLSLYSTHNMRYVLLYLHGSSSSRHQGFAQLRELPEGVGLACFDFNGCGNRIEKEFISLGYSEAEQIDTAVKFLKGRGLKVACWGRSMGSVGLLLSQQCQVIAVDSPFSSLKGLCKQIALKQVPCPCLCIFHCLFPCFFCMISSDVQQKTGMNPYQLQVEKYITTMNPKRKVLFMAGRSDIMIDCSHTQRLHAAFPGKHKKLLLFEGTHNCQRAPKVLKQMFQFIEEALFKYQDAVLSQKQSLSHENSQKQSDLGSNTLLRQDRDRFLIAKAQISSKIVEGPFSDKAEVQVQIS